MKFDTGFPKQVLVTLVIIAAAAAYPLVRFASGDVIRAVVAGAFLSTANVLLGYFAIEYSFSKSYSTFLKMILGGMGVRMTLMLAALILLIKLFSFQAVPLTVSMLLLYVVFLVLEVLFIQRTITARNQG